MTTTQPVNLKELERLYEAVTPGELVLGNWSGQCHLQHAHGVHGDPCAYDYTLRTDDDCCTVSVADPEKHATLIRNDDYGPVLSRDTATLIVAAINAVPTLLTLARQAQAAQEENKRLKDAAIERQKLFHELQVAFTGLTCGGSKFFLRDGDGFRPDVPVCVADIKRRHREADEWGWTLASKLHAAQAEVTRLQSLVDEAAGVLEKAREFAEYEAECRDSAGGDMSDYVGEARDIADRLASFLTRLRAQPNTTENQNEPM